MAPADKSVCRPQWRPASILVGLLKDDKAPTRLRRRRIAAELLAAEGHLPGSRPPSEMTDVDPGTFWRSHA